MRFISVCSGIEAASVALEPLGYVAVGFAEIDRAASLVLAQRFGSNMPGEPLSTNGIPNYGDFTLIDPGAVGPVDLLIGGTPCQGFSIAGLRGSLADVRSNLALAFLVLAHDLKEKAGLRNILWENVPGVLNTPDNAFGCFLAGLVGHDAAFPQPRGAGWPRGGMVRGPRARAAWRVLDAQYFGLAQRRERVFVVADFGNGADPVEVLFERQGVRGNIAPSREPGQAVARPITPGSKSSSGYRNDADTADNLVAFGGNRTSGPLDVATSVLAHGGPNQHMDFESETFIVDERAVAFKPSHYTRGKDGAPSPLAPPLSADADKGDQDTVICAPVAYRTSPNVGAWETGDRIDALTTSTDKTAHVLAFQERTRGDDGRGYDRPPSVSEDVVGTLETVKPWSVAYDLRGREGGAEFEGPHDTANIRAASGGSSRSYVAQAWAVRRLLPVECERLQGFADFWTAIPKAADGPRYKQLGNSFAVPVVRWIGKRIKEGCERMDNG